MIRVFLAVLILGVCAYFGNEYRRDRERWSACAPNRLAEFLR